MGKGDKKSRRGKIIMGSYGVRRPQRTGAKSAVPAAKKATKPAPAKDKAVKVPKAETKVETPEAEILHAESTKPARKKTAPKASAKKEVKAED